MCLALLLIVEGWLLWYSYFIQSLVSPERTKAITSVVKDSNTVPDPTVCDELDSILVHASPVSQPIVYHTRIVVYYMNPLDLYTLEILCRLVVVDLILCIAPKVFKLMRPLMSLMRQSTIS